MPAVSGIVLAGGRSARFGRDKLAEPIGDTPLLHRAIDAVAAVAAEVIVVAPPDIQPPIPDGVRLVHDSAPYEGPLAGCLIGLTAAREPLVLVAGGDMPFLEPAVLELLVRSLEASATDAVLLEHRGRRQQLPFAIRTGAGTDLATRLLAQGERRLGAIAEHLIVRVLLEGEWRPLDPEARTLRDVDEPDDLPPV
ncbi:MAG TPA: molybdenum cofactor guanylyltransferase [Candidatus Limnocylindrales bacterium]|nr:molybdenum cofactor guanylyltransferase [Candidatus Limnocylindrales bacterium]